MSNTKKIEWADSTWNPITGCTPCSPGCDRCYARTMLARHLPMMGHNADPGMTLRDWFAGKALVGLSIQDAIGRELDAAPRQREEWVKSVAKDCYDLADAILAERERRQP